MRCRVGVNTNQIVLKFSEHDWANVKMAMPAPVGHRSWVLQERDGGVLAMLSRHGVAPARMDREPDVVRIMDRSAVTVVRCHIHEREVEFPRKGQLFIPMPPHHLWPWMEDGMSKTTMAPEMWRWHLVREINARLRSAKAAGGSLDLGLPGWALRMLTTGDGYRLNVLHEEI